MSINPDNHPYHPGGGDNFAQGIAEQKYRADEARWARQKARNRAEGVIAGGRAGGPEQFWGMAALVVVIGLIAFAVLVAVLCKGVDFFGNLLSDLFAERPAPQLQSAPPPAWLSPTPGSGNAPPTPTINIIPTLTTPAPTPTPVVIVPPAASPEACTVEMVTQMACGARITCVLTDAIRAVIWPDYYGN